jgi:pimeloyl-ACP methyl ester carboxylesterase
MRFTNVEGVQTWYSRYGKDKDKHVLFIHGLGSSSIAWRDIPYALSLSNSFDTITVDLIGFGESDKPEDRDYTIKGFSKFILDFIETIGIKNKISIVGHSLGGYIAAQVAIENKKIIEKLLLIDSSGLLENPTPPLLKQYLDAAMEIEPVLRYKKLDRVLGGIYANPALMPPIVVENFIGTITKEGARSAFKKAYENSTSTQIDAEGFKQIQDIPCLIIWGKEDRLIPIEYCEKFKQNLSGSETQNLIIKDTGHAPFVERTALVYEKLRTFLS